MKFKIKNRFSRDVQFECELPAEIAKQSHGVKLGFAVRKAIEAGAYLARANLSGADLSGAYLARADLSGAYLAGADLSGAYLARADLSGAYLADAYLAGADLSRADLSDADLARAYLARADLSDADLADAYLAGADLSGADLAGVYLARAKNVPNITQSIRTTVELRAWQRERALRFRARFPDVPVIEQLDAKILAALESGAGTLDMSTWHRCETTHCRAGWAIALAGDAGAALEQRFGAEDAGRRIYLASTGRVPDFFANNEDALADMREQAALFAEGAA